MVIQWRCEEQVGCGCLGFRRMAGDPEGQGRGSEPDGDFVEEGAGRVSGEDQASTRGEGREKET
jgi:hypothetical protein